MNNKGIILKILGIIFLIIVVIIIITVIYFYNFYVFTSKSICITEDFQEIPPVNCTTTQQCIDIFKQAAQNDSEQKMPDVILEKLQPVIEKSISCDNICKLKNIQGMDFNLESSIEQCNGEKIIINFYGKDFMRLWRESKN